MLRSGSVRLTVTVYRQFRRLGRSLSSSQFGTLNLKLFKVRNLSFGPAGERSHGRTEPEPGGE